MKPVNPRIEPLLSAMAHDPRLPPNAEADIRQAIAESPYLSNLLARAIEKHEIGAIGVSHGQHNGGHFEDGENGVPGTLYISESVFRRLPTDQERIDQLTEVMGHETMHGVLSPHRAKKLAQFRRDYGNALDQAHAAREPTVNLTGPVRTYLELSRQDEALAEISALRALHSRIQRENPSASEQVLDRELRERSNTRCVNQQADKKATYAPGLTYEALTRQPAGRDDALTAAVERCFFDGRGNLGPHGDSDYRNYYGTLPLSEIAAATAWLGEGGRTPPQVRVDLRALGLDPAQLERNGLDLGKAASFPLLDLGPGGLGEVRLNHTGPSRLVPPERAEAVAQGALTPADPGHPDHALLEQIRDRVKELDARHGKTFDHTSERISANLLGLAKENRLQRVDHVVVSRQTDVLPAGHNIFVVQGRMDDPAMLRAHMPTVEAAQRPIDDAWLHVETLNHRQAQAQLLEAPHMPEPARQPMLP